MFHATSLPDSNGQGEAPVRAGQPPEPARQVPAQLDPAADGEGGLQDGFREAEGEVRQATGQNEKGKRKLHGEI